MSVPSNSSSNSVLERIAVQSSWAPQYGTYSGTTTFTPQYGVAGYTTGTNVSTVYTRTLAIDIVDRDTAEKVWELKLSSSGSCGRFAGIAPALFDAAFQSFPQGGGGDVVVEWDGTC